MEAPKSQLWALVVFSLLAFWVAAKVKNIDLTDYVQFFSLAGNVVTADVCAIFLFRTWLWKIPWLRGWLVPFPNLSGTWTGQLKSDWVDPESGKESTPKEVMLTIKQSYTHISCVMHSAEMKSHSFAEGLQIQEAQQTRRLVYTYTSVPRTTLDHRSTTHVGTMLFDIIEKPTRKLKGHYWTARRTKGEVELEFFSKNIYDHFLEDLPPRP